MEPGGRIGDWVRPRHLQDTAVPSAVRPAQPSRGSGRAALRVGFPSQRVHSRGVRLMGRQPHRGPTADDCISAAMTIASLPMVPLYFRR